MNEILQPNSICFERIGRAGILDDDDIEDDTDGVGFTLLGQIVVEDDDERSVVGCVGGVSEESVDEESSCCLSVLWSSEY